MTRALSALAVAMLLCAGPLAARTVTIRMGADFSSLDPAKTLTTDGYQMASIRSDGTLGPGLAEALPAPDTGSQRSVTANTGDEWLLHPGSVDRPDNCELLILAEDFRPVPTGEIGEIVFRPAAHPAPSYRYIGSPPACATPHGFISVGDLGYVDVDGYLFLVDRRVDMIVTGGANVYPAEVEAALTEHPGVVDAAVIGLPDEEWGKRVHAVIEPSNKDDPPTTADLAAWLRERLTPYKIPKSFKLVEALPRNAAGKVRRSALVTERASMEA